jgi:hypothetical protein
MLPNRPSRSIFCACEDSFRALIVSEYELFVGGLRGFLPDRGRANKGASLALPLALISRT